MCAAVEGAPDMELVGRADPLLGVTLAEVLAIPHAEVVVDFTRPDTALENALACVRGGVHVVIGTTGFDSRRCWPTRRRREGLPGRTCSIAPNFAIGAVLMMRFAAEAARHMAKARRSSSCTTTASSTRPSGTAAAHRAADGGGRASRRAGRRSTRCACPAWSPTRR